MTVFDTRAFYLLTQEQFCVSFMRKMDLKFNQTVTKKPEQCCKVTDITVMVVINIFTVDVNNEIVQ